MTNATVHDVICHMDIVPATAAGTSEHQGTTYYFCSRGCKLDFDDDPEAALKAEAEYDHDQPIDHGMMAMSAAPAPVKRPWWQFWRSKDD
jgi:Cu+-exporting ATPase